MHISSKYMYLLGKSCWNHIYNIALGAIQSTSYCPLPRRMFLLLHRNSSAERDNSKDPGYWALWCCSLAWGLSCSIPVYLRNQGGSNWQRRATTLGLRSRGTQTSMPGGHMFRLATCFSCKLQKRKSSRYMYVTKNIDIRGYLNNECTFC